MDSTKSAFGMTDLQSRMAHDVSDFCDSLWLTLDGKGWREPRKEHLRDGGSGDATSANNAPPADQ